METKMMLMSRIWIRSRIMQQNSMNYPNGSSIEMLTQKKLTFKIKLSFYLEQEPIFNSHVLYVGWIPRIFKIFILKPKLSFLGQNHKNDN